MTRARGGVDIRGVVASLGSLALAAGVARAQAPIPKDRESFSAQVFLAPVGSNGFVTLDSAQVPAHKQFSLSLASNYQKGAFSINVDSDRPELVQNFNVVDSQLTSELTAAIGLFNRFELGLAVPLHLRLTGQDYNAMGQPSQTQLLGSGLGDLRFEAKATLAAFGPADEFVFALSPGVTIPTGDGEKFLGDKTASGRLRAIIEYRLDDFRTAAMAGVLGRGSSQTFQAQLGSQFLYALAIDYRLHKQASILAEWFGRLGSVKYVDVNPSEVDVGMRVRLPHMLAVAFGGGAGLNRGIGAPRFRAFLALGWSPDFRDRDADGIVDVEDRCADDREDHDGFKDNDGCPDPDNDGDGILDKQDKCPDQAEDPDGFEDADGCPEPDNDKDGVLDLDDACPIDPGPADNKGCPKKPALVVVTSSQIKITQQIHFEFDKAKIKPDSFPILNAVAQVLKDNPDISLEIGGHTDNKGAAEYNKKLSGLRAESVRTYVMEKGVSGSRLTAKGYGMEVPIDTNATDAGRAKNRRVEFVRTDAANKGNP